MDGSRAPPRRRLLAFAWAGAAVAGLAGCGAAGSTPAGLPAGDPVVLSYDTDGRVRGLIRLFDDGSVLIMDGASCRGGQLSAAEVQAFRSTIESEGFRSWFAATEPWDGYGSCRSPYVEVFQLSDQARQLPCVPLPLAAGYELGQIVRRWRRSRSIGPLISESPLPQIEARRIVDGNATDAVLVIGPTGKVVRRFSDGSEETGTLPRHEVDAVRLIVRYSHQDHGSLLSDGYEISIDDQPPILVAVPGDDRYSATCPELSAIVMIAERAN